MTDASVNRIIADAMDKVYPHPWDGQDKYPVIVETVQRHLVWVEADSLKDAVEGLDGDPDWYQELTSQNQIESGYDWSVEAPEDHNWGWEVYPSTRVQGPRQACTECGTVAHAVQWKPWHKEGCTSSDATRKVVTA
ncbi:hypothetical protein OG229_02800 [Streptomyces platensis]|uniref:hypothetical protein n=1 Tax=Streptomyces platensis TaxID=58346 RepID=UPI002E12845A|nr:hypothetical protein OG229_02800 [Streptomyces platensis]